MPTRHKGLLAARTSPAVPRKKVNNLPRKPKHRRNLSSSRKQSRPDARRRPRPMCRKQKRRRREKVANLVFPAPIPRYPALDTVSGLAPQRLAAKPPPCRPQQITCFQKGDEIWPPARPALAAPPS